MERITKPLGRTATVKLESWGRPPAVRVKRLRRVVRTDSLPEEITSNGGEEELLCAILMRAVLDLFSRAPHIAREARGFFLDVSEAPWSYNWILGHLDMEPSIIRDRLIWEGLL